MNNEVQRAVPQAIESEQSVLGALMLDNDSVDRIGNLKAAHFFRGDHRAIFAEIVSMIAEDAPADSVTVFQRMQSKGASDAVGGLPYLNALAQNTPSAVNIQRYAEAVIDRAKKRELMTLLSDNHGEAGNTPKSATDLIDQVGAGLEKLSDEVSKSEDVPVDVGLQQYFSHLQARADGKMERVATGLTDLDQKLGGGFEPGNLVVVAGRPGHGKTAISLAIATYCGANVGPVLFQSMEMSNVELQERVIASQGRVSMGVLRGDMNLFSQEDWERITAASNKINAMQLTLNFQSSMSLMEIRNKVRAFKRKQGLKMLVLDYLSLMKLGDEDRHDLKIAAVTRGLKELAKDLGIVVVLLVQMNRAVDSRAGKLPVMSDLKDSGAIEADANTIIFVHRDEIANPDSPNRGIAEIVIGKQRQGETGIVRTRFFGEYQRFEDIAQHF
jgi:replicative DNA helicase